MIYKHRTIEPYIIKAMEQYPIIVIRGPRQTGKTTLCNHLFPDFAHYNLEDLDLRMAVEADVKGFLAECGDKVVIDEAQRLPQLFSYLMVHVDNNPQKKFVLTGSSNYTLMQSVSQSLVGRAALFTLLPFSLAELDGCSDLTDNQLLYRGFFPATAVLSRDPDSFYDSYLSLYVERDVRQIKEVGNLSLFRTFLKMLAARVGTEFNASALGNEIGVSSPTMTSWLGILETSYICHKLTPYHVNINKRLTKRPKIFFADCGLLCALLDIFNPQQLIAHPLRGQIFENMVVNEFLKRRYNMGRHRETINFYREASGREVDVLETVGPDLMDAFEIKSGMTYHPDFLKGLDYIKEKLPNLINDTILLYAGQTYSQRIQNYRQYFCK